MTSTARKHQERVMSCSFPSSLTPSSWHSFMLTCHPVSGSLSGALRESSLEKLQLSLPEWMCTHFLSRPSFSLLISRVLGACGCEDVRSDLGLPLNEGLGCSRSTWHDLWPASEPPRKVRGMHSGSKNTRALLSEIGTLPPSWLMFTLVSQCPF